MGAVDLVIQIEAPPTIASGIQRIGRSGHAASTFSRRGVIFPKYRGDLLACAGATGRMIRGPGRRDLLPAQPARRARAADRRDRRAKTDHSPWTSVYAIVRGAAPFAEMPRRFVRGACSTCLSGRYPSEELGDLRPRRHVGPHRRATVSPRQGRAACSRSLNGGTIPDRGLYGVFLAGDGPEENEARAASASSTRRWSSSRSEGDVFLLGASSWRASKRSRTDRVLVDARAGRAGQACRSGTGGPSGPSARVRPRDRRARSRADADPRPGGRTSRCRSPHVAPRAQRGGGDHAAHLLGGSGRSDQRAAE